LRLGDVNMMPFVDRLDSLNWLDVWIADRPATQAWWKRTQELPTYMAAIRDRLSAADIEPMRTFGGRIKDRVAFHRAHFRLLEKAIE